MRLNFTNARLNICCQIIKLFKAIDDCKEGFLKEYDPYKYRVFQ